VFGALVRIGGSRMLADLADFFSLVEGMFATLLARVQTTQRWLHEASTEMLVVTSVRDDGAQTAKDLARSLSQAGLVARAVVLNRALPPELPAELTPLLASASLEAVPVLRYALAYAAIQARVIDSVRGLAPTTAIVPDARGLDGDARLESLAQLGQALREALR
jgi:hypothetical protein